MAANLRLSLWVFIVGFAVEAAGDLYLLIRSAGPLGHSGAPLVILSPLFTLVGLICLWIGRREWNEVHRGRVRLAHFAFLGAIVSTALAAAPVAYLVAFPTHPSPGWIAVAFGAAVAGTIAFTFLTYGLVAGHLVGAAGRAAIGAAVVWGTVIGFLIGFVLGGQIDSIVGDAIARHLDVSSLTARIGVEEALLGVSYLLLMVAYLTAERRVAHGLPAAGTTPPHP